MFRTIRMNCEGGSNLFCVEESDVVESALKIFEIVDGYVWDSVVCIYL